MASSTTVNCFLYSYTPCCGGHPVYLARFDTESGALIFPDPPGVPHVWQYNGPAPYTDHLGHSLIPGQCYYIQYTTITVNGPQCNEPYIVASPTLENFSETSHENCITAVNDPKCDCPKTFEFISCCTGESTIYNVTGIVKEDQLVSGNSYLVNLDLGDLTTLGCYTINQISVTDPESLPTIDIENIATEDPIEEGCNDFLCQLLCQDCRCETFENQSPNGGFYVAITCDFQQVSIVNGNPLGSPVPLIEYVGDPTLYPLTEGLCLRYWQELTQGLNRIDSGLCEIVYWNENGSEINCPIYYKIVNCQEPFNEICVTNDLSAYFANNEVITIDGQPNLCWSVEQVDLCVSPVTVIVTQSHVDCPDCLEKVLTNYELINCNDESQIIYTSSDLSGFGPYVSLEEYPDDCWLVTVLTSNTPSDIPVTPLDSFGTCIECSQQYYILEDCDIDDPELPIITGTNLSAYVGQVITLASCPDICWQVSETDNTIGAQPVLLNGIQVFQTCELCIQPTPIPTPPVYKYKSVKPGYNTPGCSPEKYEQYMCNFSEAMYRQVMVDAYGIEPCCGDDDVKWQIKKELIELKAITDPDYNCLNLDSCACTTTPIGLTPCEPTPTPPPVVSYNCVETPTCVQYVCIINPLNGGTLFYKDCEGVLQQQSFPMGKFPVSISICSIPNATSNDIYVTGSPSGFTFSQTPVICESTLDCVEVQGTGGQYSTLVECQTNCSPAVFLSCDECITITIIPVGGGTPVEITMPPTGLYSNNTPYYYFTYDGIDYEIYNSTWDQIGANPGTWLLFSYDLDDDIGQYGVVSTCPIGTYDVDPTIFDSFVVGYCGGEPTGNVLYSVFLNSQGSAGVYFTYPDCNNVTKQVNIPASRSVTNVFVCSKPGRLLSEFVQNGGTDFNVIETVIPCNC